MQIWMQAAGAVCIVSGASGFGFWMAGEYRRRLEQLLQLRQMIYMLKGQILYANAPLSEALEAVGKRFETGLSGLFTGAAGKIEQQGGETFCQIWEEEVGKISGMALTKQDRQYLAELGKHLGYLDRDMQERTLLLYLEQLDVQIQLLREHRQERCRLYSSLGIMSGLFLTILLI